MRKIAFVTGANGFVGSHLVEYLLQQNCEVHCLLRASSNDRWLRNLPITIHRGGIEDVAYLKNLFEQHKPNYIFHLAGTVTAINYEAYERGNVKPTRCILEASLSINSIEKIIVTSSLAASCPTQIGHPNDETCPQKPLTDYGRSKVAEENLARDYMDKLPIAIVRPPVVYGERETEVLLFFKTVSKCLIPIIGYNNKTLSLVYVSDLVRGFYQCAISSNTRSQTYFIGGYREEYTWLEMGKLAAKTLGNQAIALRIPHWVVYTVAFIAENIARLSGKAAPLNLQKASEMVCDSWSCSSQKAKRDFGYQPQVDIEEGFAKTIRWYREQGWI